MLFGSLDGREVWIHVYIGLSISGSLTVKNLPEIQETLEMQLQSMCLEDPLEEGMATYSSIVAWKISWTEEPDGLQSRELQRTEHN